MMPNNLGSACAILHTVIAAARELLRTHRFLPSYMRPTLIWVVFVLGLTFLASAEKSCARQETIERLDKPMLLDGRMTDPRWKAAPVYRDFKTVLPQYGKTPSQQTEVYLAQDARTLYVAVRSFDDEPKRIRAGNADRGDPWKGDWVTLCLDSENDHLSSFYFLVTPANARAAGILDSNGAPLLPYTLNWQSAASTDERGWIAEMAIPLTGLPHPVNSRVKMSFKVARFISRNAEEADFPENDPQRMNLERFHTVLLCGVPPSALDDQQVFRKALDEKKQDRLRLRLLDNQQQLEQWGKASVLDYLVFPSTDFAASDHPLQFQRSPEDAKVAELLVKMEYAPGRQVGNLQRFLIRSATTSLIVIKDDQIRYEQYFNGYSRDSICSSFSVAKSFDSALVGIAIADGKIISVHDPITKYLPELLQRDPRFAAITIKDLLQMSAGIRYEESPPYHDDDVTYHAADLRTAALEQTAIVDPPGKYFLYNDYHPLLIGLILERATGQPVSQYFQKKIWDSLRMEYAGSWSTDLEHPPFEKMLVGINARAIDFAKFGSLMLHRGQWQGQRVLSEQWVQEATQEEEKPAGYYRQDADFFSNGHYYKYFWWGDQRPDAKSDFHAAGNRGQYIYVSPERNVVIVRTGFDYGVPTGRWLSLFRRLADNL